MHGVALPAVWLAARRLEGRGGACIYSHGMSFEALSKSVEPPDYSPEGLAGLEAAVDSGFPGFRLPPRLQLLGCTISSKRGDGVFLEYGARGMIRDCEITRTKGTGVQALECLGVCD